MKKNFRFYDNRQKYLLFVTTTNEKNQIAVKTPYGISQRFTIQDIIMQGTVFGPLACTASMSKLGDLAYKTGKSMLTYKDTVQVPPLGMIDDLCVMSKCGLESLEANSMTNSFIE